MMLKIIKNFCGWLSRRLNIVANLIAENIALRHQLIVLKRNLVELPHLDGLHHCYEWSKAA